MLTIAQSRAVGHPGVDPRDRQRDGGRRDARRNPGILAGMSRRRRYAIVGTGARAGMFVDAIAGPYRENAELVGLCDLSQRRMDWHNARLRALGRGEPCPTFLAARVDAMVTETRPDTVIVATVDATHLLYITRAMDLGCDVITEKPM